MKRLISISIFLFFSSNVKSQNLLKCDNVSNSTSIVTVSQSTNCIELLDHMVPGSNDPVLEVNVNFWIFTPTTNTSTGAWTTLSNSITAANVQACIDGANSTFSNMPAPTISITGVTSITNAKMELLALGGQII